MTPQNLLSAVIPLAARAWSRRSSSRRARISRIRVCHIAARLLAPVAEGDDLLDLIQAQTQPLRGLDEDETLDVGLLVGAVSRRRAGRIWQEADPFIETDGLGGDSESVSQLPDSHGQNLP